ncbi:hypothetical protein [Pseudomonas rhizosphaerae]|uniref:hypothetical protein n=1 Tax=Pseudomonas rhizosphaerae TaxID=216142 RepID=UPI002B4967F4|nr:hypothetical protein [Pseudomonas rhizosphaerae]MEB2869062.1 hypothetical protein [Pseudomonas rhizosphaerae]
MAAVQASLVKIIGDNNSNLHRRSGGSDHSVSAVNQLASEALQVKILAFILPAAAAFESLNAFVRYLVNRELICSAIGGQTASVKAKDIRPARSATVIY